MKDENSEVQKVDEHKLKSKKWMDIMSTNWIDHPKMDENSMSQKVDGYTLKPTKWKV